MCEVQILESSKSLLETQNDVPGPRITAGSIGSGYHLHTNSLEAPLKIFLINTSVHMNSMEELNFLGPNSRISYSASS